MPRPHVRSLLLCWCGLAALGGTAPRALARAADSARRPDPPAAPTPRPARRPWRLGTEVAFTDISGNRQLQLFQSTITITRQAPEKFNLDLKLEGRYGESNHQEAAKSAAARVRFDWTPHALVSPFLGLDAEYDRIRKIDLRLSGGTGINLDFSYRDPTRLTVALGVVEEYVDCAAVGLPLQGRRRPARGPHHQARLAHVLHVEPRLHPRLGRREGRPHPHHRPAHPVVVTAGTARGTSGRHGAAAVVV